LNKEQRGYLTPDEFNKIATQVQLEEFEKFFEDYNQYLRMPKTDEEFASRVDHIREEFQVFEKTENASAHAANVYTQPTDLHRFGSATYAKAFQQPAFEIVSSREYREQVLSPLLQPSMNFPIAKYQQDKLTVFPPLATFSNSDVSFNYIRKPEDVRWGYVVGSLGQYIYDDTAFSDTKLAISSLAGSINFNSAAATVGTYPLAQGTGANTFQTSGAGTGAKLSVVISGTSPVTLSAANTSISVTEQGTGYAVGDTLTIATSSFTGLTALITITLTSANLMSGTGQGSKQFEISDSLQTNLILGVLKYAGVIVKDTQVIQAASGLQQLDEQNSKK
jgi:hypothetical protein